MASPAGSPPPKSLADAIRRLEEIGRRLEREELELDESLALYEEGVGLLRTCEAFLSVAETRIEQLKAEAGSFRLDPLPDRP